MFLHVGCHALRSKNMHRLLSPSTFLCRQFRGEITVCILSDFLQLLLMPLRLLEAIVPWIEGSQAPAKVFCSLQMG